MSDPFLRHRLQPRSAEVVVICCLLWWGIALLLPGATFPNVPAYDHFHGPEHLWGAVALAAALSMLTGAALAALGIFSILARRWLLLLTAAFWAYVAWNFAVYDPTNTGAGVYAVLAGASAWCYMALDPS
jgi:hypothetical protein